MALDKDRIFGDGESLYFVNRIYLSSLRLLLLDMRTFALGLLFCVGASMGAADPAPVIPAARTFPEAWRNAGHPGGDPVQNRTVSVSDFGAVGDNVADDRSAFVQAISSLGGNPGVVFVPPGNFRIKSPLNIPSGVLLRGQSVAQTTLTFDFVGDAVTFTGSETGSWTTFSADAAMHDDTITVSNAAPFIAGTYALLTQTDDSAWNITDSWGMGSAGQVVKIVSVIGNQLQFERPLRHDYPLTRTPKIRPLAPVRNSGIENLTLTRLLAGDATSRNNTATVRFSYAVDCWMRGVHSKMAFGSHVTLEYSSRVEVTGCYLDDAHEFDGGGSGYGAIFQFRAGECLVQNNIFRRLRHAMIMQAGANGNVVAYNYSREGNSDSHPGYAGDMCLHGNYPYANLFEGNIGGHIWIDASHDGANGPFNTFFRNRAQEAGFNMTDIRAHQQNVVGNELFKPGFWGSILAGNGYSFKGTNHFTYGNNSKASGLQPAGTGNLADYSYYLNSDPTVPPPAPAWWTITNTLPTVGAPLPFDPPAKKIPASARWDAAQQLTVPAPVPILSTASLVQLNQGTNATASFAMTNAGEGLLHWILTSVTYGPGATNWVTSVSPTNAIVGTNPSSVTITANRSVLGATPSTATLHFQSNGGAKDVTVEATAPTYQITTTSGSGGSVSPQNPQVMHGQSVLVNITPDTWFASEGVLVDGVPMGAAGSYTFSQVTSSHTLHATFAPQMVSNSPVPIPKTWLASYGITNAMEEATLADLDGDSVPSWQEFLADTDPTDSQSVFHVASVDTDASNNMVLHFAPSSPARVYSLQQNGDLSHDPWVNTPGFIPRPGTGGADHIITPPRSGTRGFYRVGVMLPE